MKTMVYTHEGWFGICPVWIADPYGEMIIRPKMGLEFLLNLSVEIQNLTVEAIMLFNPSYEAGFAVSVKKLRRPKKFFEDDDTEELDN